MSAGEYTCYFEARGFSWELSQVVKVPLQATEVTGLPDQLLVSCATPTGFQLSCCVPSTHETYTASWSPGGGGEGRSTGQRAGAGGLKQLALWLPEAEAAIQPGSLGSSHHRADPVSGDTAVTGVHCH